MDNPKYIQVMRQVASDFDGISHELFQVASDLERMDQYNPQQKLFSLVRSAEVSSVTLRNLTARTVRDDTAPFYCEVADLLGIKVEETHDWLKISVPAILPKRNQRDNQAFLTRPLRHAIMDYAATLRLAQGEYVTDVRFEFGTVPSGFSSVVKPTMRVQVLGTVSNGYQIINRADVGGQYLNEWQTAKTTWVTTVRRFNTTPLPKTGY